MKNRAKLLTGFALGLAFFIPSMANAQVLSSVLVSQEIESLLDSGSGAAQYTQTIGTGYTGVIGSVILHAKFTVSGSPSGGISVSFSTLGQCAFESTDLFPVGSVDDTFVLDLQTQSPSNCTISTTTPLVMSITRSSRGSTIGAGFQMYGASTTQGFVHSEYAGGTPTTNIANLFFRIAGVYQQIGVNNPYVVGLSTTTVRSFCNESFATSTGFFDSVGSSISNGLCNVFSFLFVPNQSALNDFHALSDIASERIPFSYFYDLNSIISTFAATSSSADFYTIGFYADDLVTSSSTPLSGSRLLPHTFIGLSTTTISTYYPDSVRLSTRNVISFVLWAGFGMFLFYQALMIITGQGRLRLWSKNFPDDF